MEVYKKGRPTKVSQNSTPLTPSVKIVTVTQFPKSKKRPTEWTFEKHEN